MIVAAPVEPKRSKADAGGPERSKADAGGPERRTAGPLQVVKAVLSAFIGIRRGAAHENYAARITPVQAIVTGIAAAALLVAGMALLVHFIMSRLG